MGGWAGIGRSTRGSHASGPKPVQLRLVTGLREDARDAGRRGQFRAPTSLGIAPILAESGPNSAEAIAFPVAVVGQMRPTLGRLWARHGPNLAGLGLAWTKCCRVRPSAGQFRGRLWPELGQFSLGFDNVGPNSVGCGLSSAKYGPESAEVRGYFGRSRTFAKCSLAWTGLRQVRPREARKNTTSQRIPACNPGAPGISETRAVWFIVRGCLMEGPRR